VPGQDRKAFFKRFLELPHGIPDAYTSNWAFSSVEPAQLIEALDIWYAESGKSGGRLLNIDGKTIQGSASQGKKVVHLVSLWFKAERMVPGQKACEEKSTEIITIPELLDQLDGEVGTITLDDMGYRTAAAEKIREKQADYVLPVKENQPELYNDIQDYFDLVEEQWEWNPPSDVWSSGEGKKKHGWIESSEVLTEEQLDWLSGRETGERPEKYYVVPQEVRSRG
jgi:predicted transposase YbfD/YdcC